MLLDLHMRKVRLENGWILYNDVKTPLAVEGDNLRLTLDAGGPLDHQLYVGNLDWQNIRFMAKRFVPVPVSVAAKFTFSRDGFTLEQGVFSAGQSHVDVQAEMTNFADPQWKMRYRGWLELGDLRETLRQPLVPTGRADFRGEGTLVGGKFNGTGSYSGRDIALPYDDFHANGLTSHGNVRINNDGLEVPDFFAGALGGTVKGRVTLRFAGLQFHADTRVEDIRLAKVLPAIQHRGFPVDELHWDTHVDGGYPEVWTGAFEHFGISAKMQWMRAGRSRARDTKPVSGDWQFIYKYDTSLFTVVSGAFQTPSTHGSISGLLTPKDSAMDLKFETSCAGKIQRLHQCAAGRSRPDRTDANEPLSGTVSWDGKISGPPGKPTFSGHVRGENLQYSSIILDSLDGDVVYSPTELSLSRGHAAAARHQVRWK